MNFRHLVILSGQGDTTISLVTPEQFAWINSPPLDDSATSWIEKDPLDGKRVRVTSGSYDNDRALQVNGTDFGTIAAAIQFANKHSYEISSDEFHGCIY
jgi:hypothetical protein